MAGSRKRVAHPVMRDPDSSQETPEVAEPTIIPDTPPAEEAPKPKKAYVIKHDLVGPFPKGKQVDPEDIFPSEIYGDAADLFARLIELEAVGPNAE